MMNRRKSLLGFLLIVALVFSFMIPSFANQKNVITFDFDDSKDAPWAEEYIGKMQAKNVIKGYEDGTFRPNEPVKRIEAIIMAVRLMGLEEEAQKKSQNTKLHFKDANNIPDWGKGHVIVALENGLFDVTEDKILPDKPASRVWIVNLLVRALGLQDEALSKMTVIPEFKDAEQIAAGSLGYVNVAVGRGLINGYADNTFKPNKNVTRGEMAAFLDRTNDGLIDKTGAITVRGNILEIRFAELKKDKGKITIETADNKRFAYSISPDLFVQFKNGFVRAEELSPKDFVTLIVKDGVVIEAYLIDPKHIKTTSNILELKIEAELNNDDQLKYHYKNKNGKSEGKIEKELGEKELKTTGTEAVTELEELIKQLALSSDMTKEQITKSVLNVLKIEQDRLKEIEIEVKFANGQKVEIEFENKKQKQNAKDKDKGTASKTSIKEFELKIELRNKNEMKLKYEQEKGTAKAEVEKKVGNNKEQIKGEEAVAELENLLDKLALHPEMTKSEIIERFLSYSKLQRKQLKELEIEIKFSNGKEIEIEIENDDEDDD